MFEYLDGTAACPSPIIKDTTGKEIANTEFVKWKVIDSHLLSCITATLTTPVFSLVLDLSTSREVWLSLEKRFTTLSRSHIHQLKDRLATVDKGTKSMEEYLKQIKEITDQLAVASCPIHDEDLVFHILHGLPSAYDAFKTSIRTRSAPITVDELTSLLCSESIHIDSHSKSSNHGGDLTVAYSAVTSGNKHLASSSGSGFRGSHFGFRGRYSSRNGYRGGGRFGMRGGGRSFGRSNFGRSNFSSGGSNFTPGDNTVICQYCIKPGHTAWNCWYRMDSTFQSSTAPTAPSATAKAFVTTASPSPSSDWYLDSAATHHLTNDLSNLHLYHPYQGSDQIMVGNGSAIPIQHSGQGNEESSVQGP